ncbi:MAG: MoaD/ThiS family protein [Archangium sp.]
MPTVELPAGLRARASGQLRVSVEAKTVREALEQLTLVHPALKGALFLDDGRLKRTVGVFLDDDDVRDEEQRALKGDDVLVLISAMAGG